MHEFTEVANYYTCLETEVDPRIKADLGAVPLVRARAPAHRRRDLAAASRARTPRKLVGTRAADARPRSRTNREYVTKVLRETSDLRLVAGGKWASMDELPDDWPSYSYQAAVHADGAPSETVVRLRMEAAGIELVRVANEALELEAAAHRVASLDEGPAVNTAPETPAEVQPFVRPVPLGDHGDVRLVNPAEEDTSGESGEPSDGAPRKARASRAPGRTRRGGGA